MNAKPGKKNSNKCRTLRLAHEHGKEKQYFTRNTKPGKKNCNKFTRTLPRKVLLIKHEH